MSLQMQLFIICLSLDVPAVESHQPPPSSSSQHRLLTSTPTRAFSAYDLPIPPSFTPPHSSSEEGGPTHSDCSPAPPYEPLFEFALPRVAMLFIGKKTQVTSCGLKHWWFESERSQ